MESVTCFDYITSLKIGPKWWGVVVFMVIKHCSILPMFEAALAGGLSYGQNMSDPSVKCLIFL